MNANDLFNKNIQRMIQTVSKDMLKQVEFVVGRFNQRLPPHYTGYDSQRASNQGPKQLKHT